MELARLPRPRRRWALTAACIATASLLGVGVVSSAGPTSSGALELHTLSTPRHFADTRTGVGTVKQLLGPARYVDVLVPGLPTDAKAVTLTVAAQDGTRVSSLKVYSSGAAAPSAASLTWTWSQPAVSTVTVPIGTAHRLRVWNARGSVNFSLDLQGYFTPATTGGAEGPMGPQGPAGADGPMGPPGSSGTSAGPAGSVYLYASNSSDQTIHRGVGSAITFDTTGATLGDISFTNGTGSFTVGSAGVYKVTFWAIADEDNQFDLRVNGQVPAMGLVVFGGLAHQPTSGTSVLTLAAGDVVTLQNISSTGEAADAPILAGDVLLSTSVGGTASTINAWITIEQLNAAVG